ASPHLVGIASLVHKQVSVLQRIFSDLARWQIEILDYIKIKIASLHVGHAQIRCWRCLPGVVLSPFGNPGTDVQEIIKPAPLPARRNLEGDFGGGDFWQGLFGAEFLGGDEAG